MICTQCGKKRRLHDDELVPCDHDLSHLKGVDWQAIKDQNERDADTDATA